MKAWHAAAVALAVFCAPPAAASGIEVAASIAPVHALVAGVMGDLGTSHLIVAGAGSPHHYALRPSDAAALQDARAVFWIGENLETFLPGALSSLAGDAVSVELGEAPDLLRLPFREGGMWAAHDHGDHGGDTGEHHAGFDPHAWLDPDNAAAMVAVIARTLADADPVNAASYEANAAALAARLGALSAELDAALEPVRDVPFVVFHDGFQYFEHRFALAGAGAVTVDPERQPGAERLVEIRAAIAERGAACVFSEPQFEPRLVAVLIEGTSVRAGVLDPLGAGINPGPELYFAMMRALAASLVDCLGG